MTALDVFVFLLLIGGLSIITGIFPAAAVLALAVFLVPVTFMMHNFWAVQDPAMKMNERIGFTKNMAMLGGIVFFFHQVGSFLGGWLGGRIYVATGRYDLVWWMAIGLALGAALLNVPVREVPVARLAAAQAAEAGRRAGEAARG